MIIQLLRAWFRLVPVMGLPIIMDNEAPDTSKAQEAAMKTATLSEDALQWAKDLWVETKPDRDAAAARATQVSDAQVSLMNTQTDLAKEYADYQRTTFRPLEQQIIDESRTIDSEANQAAAAGRAVSDVQAASNMRQQATWRDFVRMGVNPADGQFAAYSAIMDSEGALGQAAAANRAREGVKTMGRAMRFDAANMGRGLPSAQTAAATAATNAGNSSAANAQLPAAATAAGAQIVQNGFGQAINGMGQAGNLFTNIARTQAQANDDSAMWGALGNVAGRMGAAWITSDENEKTDVKPVRRGAAIAALRGLPVSEWKYESDSHAADGGQQHVGPMAQDAKRLGAAVSPDGKKINVIAMTGVMAAAVKDLDQKVSRIAAAVGVPD